MFKQIALILEVCKVNSRPAVLDDGRNHIDVSPHARLTTSKFSVSCPYPIRIFMNRNCRKTQIFTQSPETEQRSVSALGAI